MARTVTPYGACVLLTLLLSAPVPAIRDYEMQFYCKDKISMIFEDVHQGVLELNAAKLTSGASWFPLVCETTIESWYSWPLLSVYIKDADIRCSDGYIELFDGNSEETILDRVQKLLVPSVLCLHRRDWYQRLPASSYLDETYVKKYRLPARLCGESLKFGTISTASMSLRVRYTALRRTVTDDTFSLIFTAYSEGQYCYEYTCNNGHCIHKDATCTGFNSCGDLSDCDHGLTGQAVAGIAIGSLVGLCMLIAVVVALCCCVKGNRVKRHQGHGAESGTVYRASQPPALPRQSTPRSHSHPAYGVTNQAFVSAQQPAYPANFTCPVYNPLEPTSPPEYSELYPEYNASSDSKSEAPPKTPAQVETVSSEDDYSNVTTLKVRGINKESEAEHHGRLNITEQEIKNECDNDVP